MQMGSCLMIGSSSEIANLNESLERELPEPTLAAKAPVRLLERWLEENVPHG